MDNQDNQKPSSNNPPSPAPIGSGPAPLPAGQPSNNFAATPAPTGNVAQSAAMPTWPSQTDTIPAAPDLTTPAASSDLAPAAPALDSNPTSTWPTAPIPEPAASSPDLTMAGATPSMTPATPTLDSNPSQSFSSPWPSWSGSTPDPLTSQPQTTTASNAAEPLNTAEAPEQGSMTPPPAPIDQSSPSQSTQDVMASLYSTSTDQQPAVNQTPSISGVSEQAPADLSTFDPLGSNPLSQPTISGEATGLAGMPQDNLQPEMGSTPNLGSPEPAPTDLSHLTDNNNGQTSSEMYMPPVSEPENLVVPAQSAIPESINTAKSSKGSKLIIIVGVIIVLIVAAASAYFILGIGQNTPEPASLPAQTESNLTNPPTANAQPTPTIAAQTAATSSASTFSDLNGQSGTSSAKPPTALELLRQRQGQTAP